MTKEQWAEILLIEKGWPAGFFYGPMLADICDVAGPAGLAAFLLKGHFTRADVEVLREIQQRGGDAWWCDDIDVGEIADRIQALLPDD